MPRKARITIPGAVHHIMSRGIEGNLIFRDDNDRHYFLAILERSVLKSGYLVYAWALMRKGLFNCLIREYHQCLYFSQQAKEPKMFYFPVQS